MSDQRYTDKAPGKLVSIPSEERHILAFEPDKLPRTLALSLKTCKLIEEASLLLGQLNSSGEVLDPILDLYLRKEAMASNRIEGTITTARELFRFESGEALNRFRGGAIEQKEVVNYSVAMKVGVSKIAKTPISINLMRTLHSELLLNVRGHNKQRGELRTVQNAITSKQVIDETARFIPPPAQFVKEAMYDLENFINEDSSIPNLVRAALFHYQFETIHPFLDGNGRIGRLLIPLLLIQWGVIPMGLPRFYISPKLAERDSDYRNLMLRVSQNGEWDNWIEFFLEIVIAEATRSREKANELLDLRKAYYDKLRDKSAKLQNIITHLFREPYITIKKIAEITNVTEAHAISYARLMVEREILTADKTHHRHVYFATGIFERFFDEKEPSDSESTKTS